MLISRPGREKREKERNSDSESSLRFLRLQRAYASNILDQEFLCLSHKDVWLISQWLSHTCERRQRQRRVPALIFLGPEVLFFLSLSGPRMSATRLCSLSDVRPGWCTASTLIPGRTSERETHTFFFDLTVTHTKNWPWEERKIKEWRERNAGFLAAFPPFFCVCHT